MDENKDFDDVQYYYFSSKILKELLVRGIHVSVFVIWKAAVIHCPFASKCVEVDRYPKIYRLARLQLPEHSL